MAWLSLSPLVAVFIKNTLNQMPSLLSCNTNTVNYNLLHREKKQQQKKTHELKGLHLICTGTFFTSGKQGYSHSLAFVTLITKPKLHWQNNLHVLSDP